MAAFIAAAILGGVVAGTIGATIAAGTLVVGFSMAAFGTALVLGGLSAALAKKNPVTSAGAASNRLITTREAVAPWQVVYGRRKVGGKITFIQSVDFNLHLHMVITWAGHISQEIEAIYADEELCPLNPDGTIASGKYSGYMIIKHSLGAEAGQPFPLLVEQSEGQWTDAHRQSGRTKSFIRIIFNADKFPNGIPNFSVILKGVNDIYDPRTAARGWTDNVALCSANYLERADFGMGFDLVDEINQAQLEAAANDCDDLIPLAAGGTEARYRLNMIFDASAAPADVLDAMASAMAGSLAHVGDSWNVYAGVYEAPTVTLTDADLAGAVRSQSLISMQENVNGIKGTFCDPSTSWQEVDFPPLPSQSFLSQDEDIRRWGELRLAMTVTSGSQAQRLAKIQLLRARQAETLTAPFKLSALRVVAGGTCALTMTKYGYSAKPFYCGGFSFAIGNNNELVVRLSLRETSATIYDWGASEEQAIDVAPNTDLPDPFDVGVPGIPMLVESQYETQDGSGVKARAIVSWAASEDAFVTQYQLRYKVAAGEDWITRAPTRATQETLFDLAPAIYDWEVYSVSLLGVKSDPRTARIEIFGLNGAPADVAGLSVQAAGGAAYLRWDLHSDLFVREGGWITFRHSESLTPASAVWEESFTIGEAVPGNNNQASLPLKPGTYLAKAISQRGRLSVNSANASTKQATALAFVDVNSITEDPAFSGIHTNTTAPDGALKITATGLFDSIPDFDTLSVLDSYGGIAGSGTYDFAAGFDFGSVQRLRLTSRLVGLITSVNDLIDLRAGSIDDWEDFDGTAGAVCDAYVEVRETDDDPASSPSWSAWKRLDASEHHARGFDFRAQLLTADESYNVLLSELRVTAAQIY